MWKTYILIFLNDRLLQLERWIRKMEEKGVDLTGHANVKLYVSVVRAMGHVKDDPTLDSYVQGNTLGKKHRDWRRIKQFLPDRYRLFFKFFSFDHSIYFAWLNDENTLRHDGAKTDCYEVFGSMLKSKKIPSSKEKLDEYSAPKKDAILKDE